MASKRHIYEFNLPPGRVLSGKYEVVSFLGGGWEGEVYRVRERATGIERTAKLFFPQRNVGERATRFYAKKVHKLKNCPIVIPYHFQDTIRLRSTAITFLISDYVEGDVLSELLKRQPGGRLPAFTALHLLHALASGMECIHKAGEYHGDLHTDNIIVQRYGLGFELKVLDLYYWDAPKRDSIRDDVVEMVRIFYEALGGAKHYVKQPPEVKSICLGLKKSLILQKFRTATQLKHYLETMAWS